MGKAFPLVCYSESDGVTHLDVKHPTCRYFNEAIKLKCFPQLLMLGVYPNAKEVTESFAAKTAARKAVKDTRLGDYSAKAYVVGDGSTPRTGALLAFTSAWTVYSIDPNIREAPRYGGVKRLIIVRTRVEEFNPPEGASFSVIVAVHSHAALKPFWDRVPDPKVAVAIPCCVPQDIEGLEPYEYTDWGIHSPHRLVRIWRSGSW